MRTAQADSRWLREPRPIETSFNGIGCRLAEVVDDTGKLINLKGAGLGHIDKAIVDKGLARRTNGRWRHWQAAIRLQVNMADATNMPEVHENAPTLCVYSSRHLAPAVDLILRADAGRVLIALALLRNLGGLGNN